MTRKTSAVRSVLFVMSMGMISKVMGFLREMLIAHRYGAGTDTDAYFMANTIIYVLSIIAIPISSTVIPIFTKLEHQNGIAEKRRYTSNLINIILIITVLLVAIMFFFSPVIVRLFAHGFEGEQFEITVDLVRIGLPVIILSAMLGIFTGYLQSGGQFMATSVSDLFLNLTYILFLTLLAPFLSIYWMMLATVAAMLVRMLVQRYALHQTHYRHKWILDMGDPLIKTTLLMLLPVLGSVLVNDFNELIDKSFASALDEGSISALNYAAKTNAAIMLIFITSMVTVIFPDLSSAVAQGNKDALGDLVNGGLQLIVVLTLPAAAGLILLAQPVTKLAFERGAFDAEATQRTAECLIFYSLGLIGMSMRSLLERIFYAAHDMKTPLMNAAVTVLLNVTLNFCLVGVMQHRGLALATALSANVAAFGLLFLLQRKYRLLRGRALLTSAVKCMTATAVMGAAVFVEKNVLHDFMSSTLLEILILGIMVLTGIMVYGGILVIMKEQIMLETVKILRKKFFKGRKQI